MITDEELASIKLLPCPSCESHNVSARRVRHDEFFVGCMDCNIKRWCDEMHLQETVDAWNHYAASVIENRRNANGQ